MNTTADMAAWAFIAIAVLAAASGTNETIYLWKLHARSRARDGDIPTPPTRLLRYLAIAMTALTAAAYWYGGTLAWAITFDARLPTALRLVGIALAAAALGVPTYVGRGLRRLAAERAARDLATRLRNLHDKPPGNGPGPDA